MDTTKVPTQEKNAEVPTTTSSDHGVGEMLINASGHTQELDRNFGFWSACFESLVADNAWGAGSASLVSQRFSSESTHFGLDMCYLPYRRTSDFLTH